MGKSKVSLIMWAERPFGGVERRLLRCLCLLVDSNDVQVIAVGCSEEQFKEYAFFLGDALLKNISVACISSSKMGGRLFEKLSVLRFVLMSRTDVVVLIDFSRFNRIAALLFNLLHVKVVSIIADGLNYFGKNVCNDNINLRLLRSQIRHSDRIDLLYPDQVGFYRKLSRRKSDVFITPGTFTDLEAYRPAQKTNSIVMFSARLDEYKGTDLLVKACAQCQADLRHAGYKVYICGEGEGRKRLESLISRNGIEDLVFLPGYKKPSAFFPKASIACAPATISNYPSQTLAEAAACGCYAIVTNTPNSEKMIDSSFGKLTDATPESLAAALIEYISMDETRKAEIVVSAREFAEKHYSITKSLEHYRAIINFL